MQDEDKKHLIKIFEDSIKLIENDDINFIFGLYLYKEDKEDKISVKNIFMNNLSFDDAIRGFLASKMFLEKLSI